MSRIYTLQDLQTRTLSELHVLRGDALRALATAASGTPASRAAWANLDAINRIIRLRSAHAPRL